MMVLKHRDKYTSYCIWELLILFCLCICIAPFFPFWVFVVITISCLLFLPQRGWKLHNDELHYAFCLFGFGATAPSGPWPPLSRGFYITHNDAPQSVGLLWTSDRFVAETSTWQHTQHSQQTNVYVPGGIRTHNLSRRAAADLRLRPHGHWDRLYYV